MKEAIMAYPSYYDNHSILEELEEDLHNQWLSHYASCLLKKGLPDEDELEHALQKAMVAVTVARLPVHHHFRKIFVCHDHDLKTDWLVSDLALRLILVNADVSNPVVARLQVEILSGRQL